MKLFKSSTKLTNYLNSLRKDDPDITIGFVPTMGALHKGHCSLVDASVRDNDLTVASIFVNPTQFGEKKDLETYPKPIAQDMEALIAHHCDILFLPEVDEIYPKDYQQINFALDGLDLKIEGAQRPGHFQGVCNVLKRFFEIISPDRSYFGQKDFQQAVVVKKLVELLDAPLEVVVLPIAREPHGLAMSSRNERLSAAAFQKARFIYDGLLDIKHNYKASGLEKAIDNCRAMYASFDGAVIEYLVAVDSTTLETPTAQSGSVVVLTVVRYEGVRLLDNILLENVRV